MAARPVWEGHLRLSLVSCPVALYGATSRAGDVRFNLINPETGNRVRMVTVDAETGEDLQRGDLVKGYEIEKGRYVLLTDEEIRAIRLESTRTIDIERFVDAATIDRIWWDEPYYLIPSDKPGAQAFAVIREAMEKAGRIGLGRVVMHTRERIVAIEPRGEGLLVTTLRAADEVRDDAALFDEIPAAKVDRQMLQIAGQIIAQLDGKFDPSEFRDRYEDALRELIRAKDDGGDGGVPAAPPAQDNVIDLMDALRRSLGRTEAKPSRAAAAKQQSAAKRKTPSKKRAAKTATKRAAKSPRRRAAG